MHFFVHRPCELIRTIIEATSEHNITKVGLEDRANLDLPFVSLGGRVALLGDAAHPQTPYVGQGVNMAIVDAYICATRLAKQPLRDALRSYDNDRRRKDAKAIVLSARSYAKWSVSQNHFTCWAINFMSKWAPARLIIGELLSKDETNEVFLDAAVAELGINV